MAMLTDHLFDYPPPQPMNTDTRWRANIDPAPNCPRCASSNTKFCYYNNYSLSQPRYFCKGCRRYWTKGGSLRNVPVGGGCRKSRRSRSNKASSSSLSPLSGPQSNHDPSSNSPSNSSHESAGPNIDLAAVFAKFLNHNQSNVNEETNEAIITPSEASHDSCKNCLESPKFSEDMLDQEFLVMEELAPSNHKQALEEETMEGFISADLSSFDDIIEDILWTGTSNLSSLTWQPVAQLQEFDSQLLPADQSKISTNMFPSDSWSYFDTTGFEVFSRP